MQLLSFSFKGQGWELSKLAPLGIVNLLVGRNATGKTRTIKALQNVVTFMQMKKMLMGSNDFSTELEFIEPLKGNLSIKYAFQVRDGIIEKESLIVNGEVFINRTNSSTFYRGNAINPPVDKLVVQIRRDKELYPEIERLMSWVEGVVCLLCSDINSISVATSPDLFGTPVLFSQMIDAFSQAEKKEILRQAKVLGYELTSMTPVSINGINIVMVKEKPVKSIYGDFQMSSGMLRVIYLLCFLHYIKKNDKLSMLLVDDLGESLDYGRSVRLGKMVFDACETDGLQLIASSNDAFLMDVVDITHWQVLRRTASKVTTLNASNHKDLFDGFRLTGLSNFDLFSSDFIDNYLKHEGK